MAASPNTGVNTITGEGLAATLAGAQIVVDVANSPRLALSLSKRAHQAQSGGAQNPQQERSVRTFLRAIQTIFQR